jgi:electron transport complex protein RnfA
MARRGAGRFAVALAALALLAGLAGAAGVAGAAGRFLTGVRVLAPNHLRVETAGPLTTAAPSNFRLTDEKAPDVPLEITAVQQTAPQTYLLTTGERVSPTGRYHLETLDPPGARDVHPAPWALILTVILSSALINNFVFTRYLGLCVFFGVSKKRDTAVGMGITFSLVMILSALLSWVLYTFIMKPLSLSFLQVLVFIGVVAFMVQMLDTVLKKVHRTLHAKFGIYLVLITTNCIILAVPLLNAAADSGPVESLALALGSGVGFAIALFLMSCARERVELARVPQSFQGLPIAFALAGLFALAFMGFSGLQILR